METLAHLPSSQTVLDVIVRLDFGKTHIFMELLIVFNLEDTLIKLIETIDKNESIRIQFYSMKKENTTNVIQQTDFEPLEYINHTSVDGFIFQL